MSDASQIKRINDDSDQLEFETLKKDGIAKIQALCGDVWTDFNPHDPGVTLLEQLCYGLTDLAYRSGFEINDYLAGKNGKIDFERQALFRPQDILPSSPVTSNDYRKILFDEIPGIDNIWFEPIIDNPQLPRGLFSVFVKLNDHLAQTVGGERHQSNQSDELTAIFERLKPLLNSRRELLDQLGDGLDVQRDALRKWRRQVKQNSALSELDNVLTQIESILSQLDTNLTLLEDIWRKSDFIRAVLVGSDNDLSLVEQLQATLLKLEEILHNPAIFLSLQDSLPQSSAPSFRHQDQVFSLNNLLTQFDSPLSELDIRLSELDGLFSIIKADLPVPGDQLPQQQNADSVKQQIISVFSRHRNLCEDIHSVEIVKNVPYFLVGEIEIEPSYDRAKLCALIFFTCAQYISSGIRVARYESVLASEKNYEQIFSGPYTQHGYIGDQFVETSAMSLSIVTLVALIRKIEGVKQVRTLCFLDQENQKHTHISCSPLQGSFPTLFFPEQGNVQQMLNLVLTPSKVFKSSVDQDNSRKNKQLLIDARLELEKLRFEHQSTRNKMSSINQLIDLPRGQQYDLQDYYSIQNQFPAIYGINRYGVSASSKPGTKVKAKQLKAYLFPYEQLMANFLKSLQEMPRLFSLDETLKQSYFSQFLDNQNIPDIEPLYAENARHIKQSITEIDAHYDEFGNRRNRVLDTLLAMYGEEFPQHSLQHFNFYRRTDVDNWIIESKINLLEQIREISRDRARGFDYLLSSTQVAWGGQVTPLQKKIEIMLGINKAKGAQSLTDILSKRSYLVVDKKSRQKIKFLPENKQSELVPALLNNAMKLDSSFPERLPIFSDAILKEGIDLESYRLVADKHETIVCFKSRQTNQLLYLASKSNYGDAVCYAHQFCHEITQLNVACEGLHMVEHLLLRPHGVDDFKELVDNHSFYSSRISVIFPSWTARFSDEPFRRFAEEMVQRNLPAHVYATFYWLDFEQMCDFEHNYKAWLSLMQQANSDPLAPNKLDHASEKIVSFLLKNKSQSERETWV